MNHEDVGGFPSAAGWEKPIKRANNLMDDNELYDHIIHGPIMPFPKKKAIILHPAVDEGCEYVLSGEIYRVQKIIDTKDYQRREQCRVYPIGGQPFLVKESADTVLALLGWMVE